MALEQQIVAMNIEVKQIVSSDAACQRLRPPPSLRRSTKGAAFRKGREFAS
jgi:hypothetical protein